MERHPFLGLAKRRGDNPKKDIVDSGIKLPKNISNKQWVISNVNEIAFQKGRDKLILRNDNTPSLRVDFKKNSIEKSVVKWQHVVHGFSIHFFKKKLLELTNDR